MKKNILVETQNVKKSLVAIDFLLNRPVTEMVGLGLIYGPPSTGKTIFGKRAANRYGWIYIELDENITPKSFYIKLYNAVQYKLNSQSNFIFPQGSTYKIYSKCLALLQLEPQVIIVDEINKAYRNMHMFNSIRDIVDKSFTTMILIGEQDAYERLLKLNPHYFDRCNYFVKYEYLTIKDIRHIVEEKSEYEYDDEVIKFFQKKTYGKWRHLDKLIYITEKYIADKELHGKITYEALKPLMAVLRK